MLKDWSDDYLDRCGYRLPTHVLCPRCGSYQGRVVNEEQEAEGT